MFFEILIITISFFLLVIVILLIYDNDLNNTYRRNIIEWTKTLEKHIPILAMIIDNSIYLMRETYEEILVDCKKFPSYFSKYKKQFANWKHKEYIDIICKMKSQDFLEKYNQYFVNKQIQDDDIATILNNIDNKSLDQSQKEIVVSDERNTLVIAGAGSGKTLTISGKVLYLTNILKVDPKEVLLVTYTKKACEEIKYRIKNKLSIDVEAYTFHKLGMDIITKSKGFKPSVAKEDLLNEVVDNYLNTKIFDSKKLSSVLLDFFSYYINAPQSNVKYENLTEYFNEIKSGDFVTLKDKLKDIDSVIKEFSSGKTTLNRETVKSYEELAIANYLYLNNINYEYERPYPKNLADIKHSQYKPDFYLPEYDIYIEHYGITRDRRVPWLNRNMEIEYLLAMEWKRKLHKEEKNKYIESYSYYQNEGILLEKLEENLLKFKVKLIPKDKTQVLKHLVEKDEYLYSEFKKLIVTFINQYKENSFKNFDSLYKQASLTREKIFLQIIEPLYNQYTNELTNLNQIDFNDMINQSIMLINDNVVKLNYKYIIVDEYQDISKTRYNLIDVIKEKCNSKLMVVGDDWQAIYRFAGSDVSIITDFESLNRKATLTKKLNRTYRNSQELLDTVGVFIQKNNNQIKKELFSNKSLGNPIRLALYEKEKLPTILASVEEIVKEFRETKEILLLGRYAFDNNIKHKNKTIDLVKYLNQVYKNINFNFLTIHKAKGLESEHVILLNAENSRLGFPSKIADDQLLDLVLPKKEPLKFAEERRLFYVALTRTKNSVYVITPMNNPSIFITELVKDGFVPNLFNNNRIKCPKCGGDMILRDENFYGCLNYPLCDHTVTINAKINKKCPVCGDYLVKRKGPHGTFYGCNSYKYLDDEVKKGCSYTEKYNY